MWVWAAAFAEDLKSTDTFSAIVALLTLIVNTVSRPDVLGFGVTLIAYLSLRTSSKVTKVEANTNSLVEKLVTAEKTISKSEGKAEEKQEQVARAPVAPPPPTETTTIIKNVEVAAMNVDTLHAKKTEEKKEGT